LFEETPLRPHKKTDSRARTNDSTMKELLEMDTMFLPYDYTKQHPNTTTTTVTTAATTTTTRGIIEDTNTNIPASLSTSSSSVTVIDTILNSPTPSSLLRRVGGALNEKLDQTKYKSQGYYELAANDNTTNTDLYTSDATTASAFKVGCTSDTIASNNSKTK
jgi:hypothetical protein